MKKGYWTTREGKQVKIKDMETLHIYNAMCMLAGKIQLNDFGFTEFSDKHIKDFQRKLNELGDEYFKRGV